MKLLHSLPFFLALSSTSSLSLAQSCGEPAGFKPIRTALQLSQIQNNLTGNYFLCNDLALNGQFSPIGEEFAGIFDGNYKRISGLYIEETRSNTGLFRSLASNATVKRISLLYPVVRGFSNVGTIAGVNSGKIESALVTGGEVRGGEQGMAVGGLVGTSTGSITSSTVNALTVRGDIAVGGLVGRMQSEYQNTGIQSLIDSSRATAYLSGVSNSSYYPVLVGGIVGQVYSSAGDPQDISASKVKRVAAAGSLTGVESIGGIVGSAVGMFLDQGFSQSRASGNMSVGGIVGSANFSLITNTSSRGNISSTSSPSDPFALGGLGGLVYATSFKNSFYAGKLNANAQSSYNSGTVGYTVASNVERCFFDSTVNPAFLVNDYRAEARSTASLLNINTYQGWNISDLSKPVNSVWKIRNGNSYAYLTAIGGGTTVTSARSTLAKKAKKKTVSKKPLNK